MENRKHKKNKNEGFILHHYRLIIIIITVTGLLLRLFVLAFPIDVFYIPDHLTMWTWTRRSLETGLFNQYGYNREDIFYEYTVNIGVDEPLTFEGKDYSEGDILKYKVPWQTIPNNYPPLYTYIRHVMGLIFNYINPAIEPLSPMAWLTLEIPTYFADWFIALGCMFIVNHFRNKKKGLIIFAILWLSPGILLVGVLWAQCDSWFLALLVWSLYYSMTGRWIPSGIFWGLALMTKPQALFIIPAMAYYFFTIVNINSIIKYIVSALLTIILVSLPFTLSTGLAWFDNSYIFNFTGKFAPYTTLAALNFWMLELVLVSHNPDISSAIFGITKRVWGLLFLFTGLLSSFLISRRHYKNKITILPMLFALTFSVSFLFLTQVHERFIIYFIPFLLISASIENRYWYIFAGYSIISIFEMTQHLCLPPTLSLSHASSGGLALLVILSSINFLLFVLWIRDLWKSPFNDKNDSKSYNSLQDRRVKKSHS